MRALRPGSLPSDTAIRFLLLLAAVTSASLYLFQSLWFTARGELFAAALRTCIDRGANVSGTAVGISTAQLQAEAMCRSGVSREQAGFAVAGSALVLLAGWVGYRLLPGLRARRRHLAPPDVEDGAALVSAVQALSDAAGVRPTPGLQLEATNPAVSGYAFGAGRDIRLGVTGGLVVAQAVDPVGFDAVVRHELGHVANRDVPWTYYALAVWWAFLGLAVVPVVASFAVRDLGYLLRLGWRTAALAGLVGLTMAALLRTRELYADDRAAEWGSTAALDRLLGSQPEPRRRLPHALNTHPPTQVRRALLADPDGMFSASGWAGFAAGIAAGSAMASFSDLLYLVAPASATPLAALIVAPLLAAVACTGAWRVALREVARGTRQPVVLRVGVGLGTGLAIAPLLTINSAVGSVAQGLSGWAGFGVWAFGTVVMGCLVARWVVDTARLRVATALAEPRPPRRVLLAHVAVVTVAITLWLAWSAQARLILTMLGPGALGQLPVWQYLPSTVLGPRTFLAPLLVAVLLMALPAQALIQSRALSAQGPTGSGGAWIWRDQQPTGPGDLAIAESVGNAPRWWLPVTIGAAAGTAAGLAPIGVLLLGTLQDSAVRQSDDFSVLIGRSVTAAHLAAACCAAAAAALALPRGWWPLAMVSALTACVTVAAIAWWTLTIYRYGFLASGAMPRRPPGMELTYFISAQSAAQAVMPAALIAATVGSVRSNPPRRAPDPRGAPDSSAARDHSILRAGLGVLGAALAAGALVLPVVASTAALRLPVLATATFEVALPPEWQAAAGPAAGGAQFADVAQDLAVTILPTSSTAPGDGTNQIMVGGFAMDLVFSEVNGPIRILGYEATTPSGAHRVVVVGTTESIATRQDELLRLFAAVRWRTGPGQG